MKASPEPSCRWRGGFPSPLLRRRNGCREADRDAGRRLQATGQRGPEREPQHQPPPVDRSPRDEVDGLLPPREGERGLLAARDRESSGGERRAGLGRAGGGDEDVLEFRQIRGALLPERVETGSSLSAAEGRGLSAEGGESPCFAPERRVDPPARELAAEDERSPEEEAEDERDREDADQEVRDEEPAPDAPEETADEVSHGAHGEDGSGEDDEDDGQGPEEPMPRRAVKDDEQTDRENGQHPGEPERPAKLQRAASPGAPNSASTREVALPRAGPRRSAPAGCLCG